MKLLKLDYAEFYITNVCNLACPGCNRFNNYHFKGFQKWKDYKDVYASWAKILRLKRFTILGGEPLLNPDIMEWIHGTSSLWPNAIPLMTTNGFQLNKVKGLYQTLLDCPKFLLSVGIHNKKHKKQIIGLVQNFLRPPFKYEFRRFNKYREEIDIIDVNNVKIRVQYNWWFHQGAIVPTEQGTFTLHNSDPVKAHSICHSAECHHFAYGKLYKCGASALFPEFDSQFKLELSEQDRNLMNNVRALAVTDDFAKQQEFITNIKNPIPQCKFCPEVYNGKQIFAIKKNEL